MIASASNAIYGPGRNYSRPGPLASSAQTQRRNFREGYNIVSSQPLSLATGESRLGTGRINAVVDGYCQHYILTLAELDRLPDSIRFRSLVYGACSFARAIAEQRPEYPSETRWWWTRYTAANEIADLARKRFEMYL